MAMRQGDDLHYLLSDHLGSTSLTTDASGDVVSEMRYTAWGGVRYESGTTPTEYTYTGQYSNVPDFGLMYYNARWYDPYLNRFAQADTVIPGAGDSQAWDRYTYANNSPLKYTDPSGHRPDDGCRVEGCHTTPKIIADDKRKENEFRQRTEYLQCWAGQAIHCSGFDKAIIALDNYDFGDGTIQFGFNLNGFISGVGLRGDIGIAMDFKGNIAIIRTGGAGAYIGAGGGVGGYLTVTNAPSVEYLEGPNVQIGGQFGEGETVGAEFVIFRGPDRNQYRGISISDKAQLQAPWPFEAHGTATGSKIMFIRNVPDFIVDIFRP